MHQTAEFPGFVHHHGYSHSKLDGLLLSYFPDLITMPHHNMLAAVHMPWGWLSQHMHGVPFMLDLHESHEILWLKSRLCDDGRSGVLCMFL